MYGKRYIWRNNSVVVVHNLTAIPRQVTFVVGVENSECLVNVLSGDNSTADAAGKHHLLLEPFGYRWFRVGGLDYILKRTPDLASEFGPEARRIT